MFIATSSNKKMTINEAKEMDILNYFEEDGVFGNETTKVGALITLKRKYKLNSYQIVMIGDSDSDMNAAKKADAIAVGYYNQDLLVSDKEK